MTPNQRSPEQGHQFLGEAPFLAQTQGSVGLGD